MAARRITLVATVRDEGPYILEWVAFHRLIGFDAIVVCSNDCVDATPALLDVLAARGLVTHLPCSPGPDDKPQLFAYARAQAHLADDPSGWPDWTMVLDADEFLNVHVGAGGVCDLIDAVPEATGFLVNWRIFGDSGRPTWSDEPVTRRFTRAARRDNAVNLSFKTLFAQADAYHCPLLPHGPGFARDDRRGEIRVVDGSGAPLPDRFAGAETFLQSEPARVSWRLAQVNHYNTRTWEDYLVKHHRGGGLAAGRWDRDWNWGAFNVNDATDLTIGRHAEALEASLAALKADAGIAAAHRRCCALYGEHVAALKRAGDDA